MANETELRDALSAAASNGKPDTINITAGQYNTSGSAFSYNPVATENYPLIITGAGVGNTILDGGSADQVMGIDNLSGPDGNAHITVRRITFQNGNSGAFNGGGLNVATNRADITVEDCEFSGNSARWGGGFYIALNQDSATGYVYNNIAWNNTATVNGDDIYVDDDKDGNSTGSTVNLFNNDYGPDPNDFVVEAGDNLFQENNINTDPLFVDPATGDYHLEEGSLCIDAGKNSAPNLPATDFEGDPRIIDGDNDGKRKVDMGADEYRPVRLLTPNGGEVIPSGSLYAIQWVATLEAVRFKLKYSMDNGKTWRPIESGITEKSYGWTVPTPPKNKTKCLVKVMGYNASGKKIHADKSNSTFTIEVLTLTSPNGGEILTSRDQHTITWITRGTKKPVAKVILKYTKNGGKTWNAIETLTGNPGTYDWTVPDLAKTKSKCRVKVVLKDEDGKTVGSDTSDSNFIIEASL